MRKSALAIGILLVVIGLFLINQGSDVLNPLATLLGLTSHSTIETAVIPPTLITVAPMNFTWLSVHLDANVPVSGSFDVGGGRQIDFYVMNQGNFSKWREGRPSAVVLAQFATSLHNFTFTPRSEGSYYFVFENQDNSRRRVLFSLNAARDVLVVHPVVQYLGYILLAVGVLLTILGVGGGRKVPEVREAATAGWKCGFCGAENPPDQTFCESCGRSLH